MTLATAEPGEPAHAGQPAAHSVWWRWVALRTGVVHLSLCGSSFDAVAAVYGADPAQPALASGTSTDGCRPYGHADAGPGPHFDFAVTTGQTYLVAVDGANGAAGTTNPLTITYNVAANDDLADAMSLGSPTESNALYFSASAAATAQAGEPGHGGRARDRDRRPAAARSRQRAAAL